MERHFVRRGKRVTVEEIEDVAALELETDDRNARLISPLEFGPLAASGAERVFDLSAKEAAAFEDANWVFVKAQSPARSITEAVAAPRGVRRRGKVIRNSDGRICILTDELIVQVSEGLSLEDAQSELKALGLDIVRAIAFAPNMFEVRTTDGSDGIDKAAELLEGDEIILAEPSLVQAIEQRLRPLDPEYDRQWQWSNDGSNGGIAGADVSIEAAWDVTLGDGVTVAIIDNGFDAGHPDLKAGVGAQSGCFDRSGDLKVGTAGMRATSHGTFCAGMVGARHGNGQGGCGAAPRCQMTLIATLNDQVGTQATLARALAYAADPSLEDPAAPTSAGADIIACSLGPNGARWAMEAVLEAAIQFATTRGRDGRGTAVFWAVSNGNFEIRYDEVSADPRTIAVGRSTRSDTENNSAFGPELDFLAPGVSVYSADSGGGYMWDTGTSYAAPCAAGAGALALAANPALSAAALRQIMRETCDKIGGVDYGADQHHSDYGFGRINADRLVRKAQSTKSDSRAE